MPTGQQGRKTCSNRCPRNSKTKIKQNRQCNKLGDQSKEKDIECNLRLKISTEHEETMSSGKEFQVLIIRFEKKFPSRTDTIRDLYSVEFYLYPTVSTALVHSVKPKLTE